MTLKFPILVTTVVTLATPIARAQFAGEGFIRFESSLDGLDWTNEHRRVDVQPGSTIRVQFRIRVRLEDPGPSIIGFAGATMQPILTGWSAADTRVPFTTNDGSATPESPNAFGRIAPFGSSGMSSSSASGLLTSFSEGDTLRFAGSNAVIATVNRAWGVGMNQLTQQIAGTNFQPSLNVVVFKYAVDLSVANADRTLTATVPVNFVNLQRMSWFTNFPSFSTPITDSSIEPATINLIVPAPACVPLLAVSFAAVTRRRKASPPTLSFASKDTP
jgi:hypothetical protein